MGQEVFLYPKPTLDFQDKVGSILVVKNTTLTKISFEDGKTYFYSKTGRKGRLAQVANAVSVGGDNYITFHVYINGTPLQVPPFNSFQQSLGEVYKSDGRLSVPVEISQGALIEVYADNSDTGTDYTAFVRLRMEYEDLN